MIFVSDLVKDLEFREGVARFVHCDLPRVVASREAHGLREGEAPKVGTAFELALRFYLFRINRHLMVQAGKMNMSDVVDFQAYTRIADDKRVSFEPRNCVAMAISSMDIWRPTKALGREVSRLLNEVNPRDFQGKFTCVICPRFRLSHSVLGRICGTGDMVIDDMLVEVKTESRPLVPMALVQLLAYWLLWKLGGCQPPIQISKFGIYYSRQANFLRLSIDQLLRERELINWFKRFIASERVLKRLDPRTARRRKVPR